MKFLVAVPGLLVGLGAVLQFAEHRESTRVLSAMTHADPEYKREFAAAHIALLEARVLGVIAALWLLVWAGSLVWRARRRVDEMTASERQR